MKLHARTPGAIATPDEALTHSRFDVLSHAPKDRLLVWRERVGHVIDVLPSSSELADPFCASIDRYSVGPLVFTDCRSDSMLLERSLARISRDTIRSLAFHVFLEGGVDDVAVRGATRLPSTTSATLLALDMGQPVRMRRHACRVLTVFAPGAVAADLFTDLEFVHGRSMRNDSPLSALIVEHMMALARDISQMDSQQAHHAIRTAFLLLVEAFGKQAGFHGNARAAKRAAMFDRVRRYIRANLFEEGLSPESVLNALQLQRPTMYRMFQHEGGMATYIRDLRLRQAADDLTHLPHMSVSDIAYSTGFSSPSDFTRAFRRAFEISPQDFRLTRMADAR